MCEDCIDRNQNLHLCWPHASFFNTSMWIPLYVFLFISSCVFYRMLVLQSVEHPFRLSQSPWTAWCFQSRQRQVKQSESGWLAFGEHGPCAGHRARRQRTTCRWSPQPQKACITIPISQVNTLGLWEVKSLACGKLTASKRKVQESSSPATMWAEATMVSYLVHSITFPAACSASTLLPAH